MGFQHFKAVVWPHLGRSKCHVEFLYLSTVDDDAVVSHSGI